MAPPMDGQKKKRPVGAGLSLDKFASLGVSKFDKRKKLEQIKKQKLIQHSKYSKLRKKLEAQGILSGVQVKDAVAELEALEGRGTESPGEEEDAKRVESHAQSGPRTQNHGRGDEGDAGPAAARRPQQRVPKPGAVPEGKQARPGHKRQHLSSSQSAEPQLTRPQKQPRADGAEHRDGGEEGGGDDSSRPGPEGRRHSRRDGQGDKKMSRLQRLAQKVAEEKAEKQRAMEAAMREREERMQRIAAVEKARKEQKHLHFKRNAKGQPLMRYRMDKLLSQIQKTEQ